MDPSDKHALEASAERLAALVNDWDDTSLTIEKIEDKSFRQQLSSIIYSCLNDDVLSEKKIHSKVLCVVNVDDGAYAGYYLLDRKKKCYGPELTFSVGVPGHWQALDDDVSVTLYEWKSNTWDPRERPWAVQGPSRWIRYVDPATNDIIESFLISPTRLQSSETIPVLNTRYNIVAGSIVVPPL